MLTKTRNHLILFMMLLSGFMFAACSESSIDRAIENEEVAGSITEGAEEAQEADATVSLQPRWQSVMQVEGREDKKSKRFKINSPEWRISWHTEPAEEDAEFLIFLYDLENPDFEEIIAVSPESDMAEMKGKGDFVLEVRASQPYEVDIKEYR